MDSIIQTHFDREFGEICESLLRMSQLVERAIDNSMNALTNRDIDLAEKVIAEDGDVNALRFKIQETCLALIATQQPTASDLRAVVAAMYIVVEMERMGDYAAGISKTVILMSEEPLLKTLKKIPKMGEISRQMLADCIQAFIKRDTTWAREITVRDTEIDQMYKSVFDKLVEIMAHKPDMVARATYLMWCAHNLERMADRVINIAEQIIFMTTGDLREIH